ncbi:MAG: hypothetical protein ABF856_02590 [Acetobacter aceti]
MVNRASFPDSPALQTCASFPAVGNHLAGVFFVSPPVRRREHEEPSAQC